ncbi:hypothetical protein [Blastopirellula marina]|uniref:Uncharacterized protein n=1 Tax=Blastopirellula marina TaxID=124 RepID=A0A2S8GU33_9BACT|nr:hypothetical protein [Blastopirellula marina]PQO47891.1 hypothetical protein C5Y93_02305 [Blastopirellula marina]
MSNFDDPFRSPVGADAQAPEYDAQGASQGLITAVCVLTYLLAAFNLLGGGLIIAGGTVGLLVGFPTTRPGGGGPPPQMLALVKYMMIAMIVVGVIFALSSILAAIAGYGLQVRRRWGYQLGLVMAACSGVETVLVLLVFWILAPVYLFYTIFTLIVLLSPQNRMAFR